MEDEDVEKVEGDIAERHQDDGEGKARTVAGDLHERHHDLGRDESRRADDEASEIILRQVKDRIGTGFSRPQQCRKRGQEKKDQHHPRERDRKRHYRRSGEAGVGPFTVARAHGLAAHHLDACGKHGTVGREHQKDRIREPVGTHGIHAEEAADHDAVHQHAEHDRHGRQDLCCQHLPEDLSYHQSYLSRIMIRVISACCANKLL